VLRIIRNRFLFFEVFTSSLLKIYERIIYIEVQYFVGFVNHRRRVIKLVAAHNKFKMPVKGLSGLTWSSMKKHPAVSYTYRAYIVCVRSLLKSRSVTYSHCCTNPMFLSADSPYLRPNCRWCVTCWRLHFSFGD